MSQRKVQASGKFEAVEEEDCEDHQSAAGGAASRLAYNSSHTHPTTSNNYQHTQIDTYQVRYARGKNKKHNDQHTLVTSDVVYYRRQCPSILESNDQNWTLNMEEQFL